MSIKAKEFGYSVHRENNLFVHSCFQLLKQYAYVLVLVTLLADEYNTVH